MQRDIYAESKGFSRRGRKGRRGDGVLEVLDLVHRDRERVVLALVRVLEVVVDGGGPVLAHVLVGGDCALDRRRQGGDLGEDLGAGTRLFR